MKSIRQVVDRESKSECGKLLPSAKKVSLLLGERLRDP